MKKLEKQLKSLSISTDYNTVKIKFVEVLIDDENEGDEDSSEVVNKYTVQGGYRPHKDLVDFMKKLRKHALEICEIEIPKNEDGKLETKHLHKYNVGSIKIDGSLELQQSRVVMGVNKVVERTGKVIKFVTPQTTMYGESEYHNAEAMSSVIEDIVKEVWAYLEGKYEESGQLPLFERKDPKVKRMPVVRPQIQPQERIA